LVAEEQVSEINRLKLKNGLLSISERQTKTMAVELTARLTEAAVVSA
jgi:hypothetical protein